MKTLKCIESRTNENNSAAYMLQQYNTGAITFRDLMTAMVTEGVILPSENPLHLFDTLQTPCYCFISEDTSPTLSLSFPVGVNNRPVMGRYWVNGALTHLMRNKKRLVINDVEIIVLTGEEEDREEVIFRALIDYDLITN